MKAKQGLPTILMKDGYSFVCAHCVKLWKAKESSFDGCGSFLINGSECGGPLVGKVFPYYEGELKGYLVKFCFVCGEEPDAVLEVNNGFLGVCDEHINVLHDFSKPGEKPPFIMNKKVNLIQ